MSESLGDRLGRVLEGHSQAEWARRLGVAQQNISRYLAGAPPSAEFLAALAQKEGVDIGWLLTGVPTIPSGEAKIDLSAATEESLVDELRRRIAEASRNTLRLVAETEEVVRLLKQAEAGSKEKEHGR